MGYTHYFAYAPSTREFQDAWPRMVADARRIVAHVQSLGIAVTGPLGRGSPETSESCIALNGQFDHESLVISPGPPNPAHDPYGAGQYATRGFVWSFCKTARKPYDLAVCAILLRCWQLAPRAFVIGSDGGWDAEWKFGADHARAHSARSVIGALFPPAPSECPFVNTVDGPVHRGE
ncbi:hypothetical protein [Streptomyces sp. BRA346]|uniref:hypothetical protein n=1 Tax=Streptomyces sp. BRA346 TaxID=2878199 RepID=UPI0040644695